MNKNPEKIFFSTKKHTIVRYIGFIKEHNNIKEATPLDAMIGSSVYDEVTLSKIVTYLDGGDLLLGWMGYFFDIKTNTPIAPDAYYTDGLWVWPGYLSYYLKKHPNLDLGQEFFEYLKFKEFKIIIKYEAENSKNKMENDLNT